MYTVASWKNCSWLSTSGLEPEGTSFLPRSGSQFWLDSWNWKRILTRWKCGYFGELSHLGLVPQVPLYYKHFPPFLQRAFTRVRALMRCLNACRVARDAQAKLLLLLLEHLAKEDQRTFLLLTINSITMSWRGSLHLRHSWQRLAGPRSHKSKGKEVDREETEKAKQTFQTGLA